jgi:SAM-dependent methyltransferase
MSKIKFLNLGKQPITNNFLTEQNPINEFFYDLNIVYDENTKVVSLQSFVPPEKMFNETYAHRASMSITMRESNKFLSENIIKRFNPKSVLEIGSNDGIFLKNFPNIKRVGIEPCKNLAEITNEINIETYDKFWNLDLSKKVNKTHGKFDLVYSANTISHIHNLNDALKSVNLILDDDGVFILEDPSLLEVIKNTSYDQFYDEHAYVFSVIALNNLLKETELEIFDIEKLTTHGGSNRIFIKKKKNCKTITDNVSKMINEELNMGMDKLETYQKFAQNVINSKNETIKLFTELKKVSAKIIGYGATYKSSTILNYCGLDTKFIDYFTDTTETKQGKFTPGTHIPILKPNDEISLEVNYIFLGAWNFKKEIFNKEKTFIDRGGKFISHVPYPQII